MKQALIGLGANIEDPAKQLQAAITALSDLPATTVVACSAVYRSRPMGPQDQPDFLNACVELRTALSPLALLTHLQAIESSQGRERRRHWGERCIDLDLLLHGREVMQTDRLTLPHPGITERDFVLRPLIDLLGANATLPCDQRLGDLLAKVDSHQLTISDLSLWEERGTLAQ